MAVEPFDDCPHLKKNNSQQMTNGHANPDSYSDCESSYSDDDSDFDGHNTAHFSNNNQRLAIACDDGCIRIYCASDTDGLTYHRSFPRVSG